MRISKDPNIYPHLNSDGLVEIGDGQIITKERYANRIKEGKRKCKKCGHDQDSHYGTCRYTNGTMMCCCGGFKR